MNPMKSHISPQKRKEYNDAHRGERAAYMRQFYRRPQQLDEVTAQLRQLGDQRDLFEEEDEEEGDPSQLDLVGAGAIESDPDYRKGRAEDGP